jgi:hypothetical protein
MYFIGYDNDNIQFKRIYLNNEPTRYLISNKGFVFNEETNRLQAFTIQNNGYIRVTMCHNGKRYKDLMHRLVANYFIENPNNLPQVNHKNGNKHDNSVDNLEWVTPRDNVIHSYNTHLNHSGEKCNLAKVTDIQIHHVCKLLEENELTIPEIADITNTTKRIVKHVLNHDSWNRISKDYHFEHYDKYNKNKVNNTRIQYIGATLTEKQAVLVCTLIEKNELTLKQISDATEISYHLIRNIYFKNTWKFVSDNFDFSKYDKY